jgi:hypothetical protein
MRKFQDNDVVCDVNGKNYSIAKFGDWHGVPSYVVNALDEPLQPIMIKPQVEFENDCQLQTNLIPLGSISGVSDVFYATRMVGGIVRSTKEPKADDLVACEMPGKNPIVLHQGGAYAMMSGWQIVDGAIIGHRQRTPLLLYSKFVRGVAFKELVELSAQTKVLVGEKAVVTTDGTWRTPKYDNVELEVINDAPKCQHAFRVSSAVKGKTKWCVKCDERE